MTSIVAIRCKDGIVVGADSSATFGDGAVPTVEQLTKKKIELIGDFAIVAGTGYVGHQQRFTAVVKKLYDTKKFVNLDALQTAKLLSSEGIRDFAETHIPQGGLQYTALVALPAKKEPCLVELPGGRMHFQPELKNSDDLWFTSAGSGQPITDAVLTLLKNVFWKDGPPTLKGGIFTAYFTLKHVCEVNPGGIQEPIYMAVLEKDGQQFKARMLSADDLAEHDAAILDMKERMSAFRDVLEGRAEAAPVPQPQP